MKSCLHTLIGIVLAFTPCRRSSSTSARSLQSARLVGGAGPLVPLGLAGMTACYQEDETTDSRPPDFHLVHQFFPRTARRHAECQLNNSIPGSLRAASLYASSLTRPPVGILQAEHAVLFSATQSGSLLRFSLPKAATVRPAFDSHSE